MAELYSYDDVQFVDADPARVTPKAKTSTPRKPLPVALTDALRASDDAENATDAVKAVVVNGPEKAAKNLVHRMRAWVAKELSEGKSVRADVAANGDVQGEGEPQSWTVTFRVVPKRQPKSTGVQQEIPFGEGETNEEATPAEKPKRSRNK